MGETQRQPAVFLDRDGTINEEVGHLNRIERLRLIPGAAAAVRRINGSGMAAVVVTNQSGIARGLFDEALVAEAHTRLREMLRAEGASLDGIYFCPHHPTEGHGEYRKACDCRKPAPGLLLRAAQELGLDLPRSYMIGDTLKDIEAAAAAGVRGILVRTGYGQEEILNLNRMASSPIPLRTCPEARDEAQKNRAPQAVPRRPDHIAANLLDAVEWIMRNRST